MIPIIKFLNTQTGGSLEDFSPEIIDNFWCLIFIRIGCADEDASSDYTVQIGTPRAFDHRGQHEGPMWGRHYMIVNHFDAAEIRAAIEKKIAECARPTFEETALVLSRFFYWEFEDYQE
jgi:Immunity protein 8